MAAKIDTHFRRALRLQCYASAILRHHLDVFVNYDDGQIEFDETPEELNQENIRLKKLLNMSVNEIDLSVRAANLSEQREQSIS